jgi:ferredoxin
MPGGGRGPGGGGQGRCGHRGRWGRQAPRKGNRDGNEQQAWNQPAPGSPPPRGAAPRDPVPGFTGTAPIELDELKAQAQAMERELTAVRSQLEVAQVRRSRPVAAVDDALCTRCGICASICPNEAIVIEQAVRIDEERCLGCGACVQQCPSSAIRLA